MKHKDTIIIRGIYANLCFEKRCEVDDGFLASDFLTSGPTWDALLKSVDCTDCQHRLLRKIGGNCSKLEWAKRKV